MNDLDKKIGRHWKRNKNLGRIFILIELILPTKERGRESQRAKSDLISVTSFVKLFVYSEERE